MNLSSSSQLVPSPRRSQNASPTPYPGARRPRSLIPSPRARHPNPIPILGGAVAHVHGEHGRDHQGREEQEPKTGLRVLLGEVVPAVLDLKAGVLATGGGGGGGIAIYNGPDIVSSMRKRVVFLLQEHGRFGKEGVLVVPFLGARQSFLCCGKQRRLLVYCSSRGPDEREELCLITLPANALASGWHVYCIGSVVEHNRLPP